MRYKGSLCYLFSFVKGVVGEKCKTDRLHFLIVTAATFSRRPPCPINHTVEQLLKQF